MDILPNEQLATTILGEEPFKDSGFSFDLQDIESLDQNFGELEFNSDYTTSSPSQNEGHNFPTNGLHLSTPQLLSPSSSNLSALLLTLPPSLSSSNLSSLSPYSTTVTEELYCPSPDYQLTPHQIVETSGGSLQSSNLHLSFTQSPQVHTKDLTSYSPSQVQHMQLAPHPSCSKLSFNALCHFPPLIMNPELINPEDGKAYDQQSGDCRRLLKPPVNEKERELSSMRSTAPSWMMRNDLSSLHWRSAAKTRAARKRRMARNRIITTSQSQITLQASTTTCMIWSPTLPSSESHSWGNKAAYTSPPKGGQMPDSESNLRFLLQKELKPSDVGNLGRIVLPKKDAESNLPYLIAREGINIPMEDAISARVWNLRFRFWPNNKSRMYLLENTRDFIRTHHLQEGDFIILLKDDHTGKYMIKPKRVAQLDNTSSNCGKRMPRWSQFQGKHIVLGNVESHANGHWDGSSMGEHLQETLLEDLVQAQKFDRVLQIENDALPQLEHVSGIENNDKSIEELFDLKDHSEEKSPLSQVSVKAEVD